MRRLLRSIIAIITALLVYSVVFAQDGNLTGKYKMNNGKWGNGTLIFSETKNGNANFIISSTNINYPPNGSEFSCGVGDKDKPEIAERVNHKKFIFRGEKGCIINFDFSKSGFVTIDADSFTWYCGVGGYLGGTYKKIADETPILPIASQQSTAQSQAASGQTQGETNEAQRYKKTAEQGNVTAQVRLGEMYAEGKSLSKDEANSVSKQSVVQGNTLAAGQQILDFAAIQKAAEQGDAKAQISLGFMYTDGESVLKDCTKALQWFKKSAEQGNSTAQVLLGDMYAVGKCVSKDEVIAAQWYKKSAEQGDAWAQCELGKIYASGNGVLKDEIEAVQWYNKSAKQGYPLAQTLLGRMYAEGKGIPKDEAMAAQLYQKAAEQGFVFAQGFLGWAYAEGKGVQKDEVKAAQWYQKAAEQGLVEAQCELGKMYMLGKGVPEDYFRAAQLFKKSAEQGNADAQGYLGMLYLTGNGVIRDREIGCKLLRSSAEHGIRGSIDAYNKYCTE